MILNRCKDLWFFAFTDFLFVFKSLILSDFKQKIKIVYLARVLFISEQYYI